MPTYHLRTKQTWQETINDLGETMRKWGVVSWSVEPTHTTRTASKQALGREERRVTLTYRRGNRRIALAMDAQDRPLDNLRVLYLVVEALRMNESRGLADTIGEAYRQQLALPPPSQDTPAAPGDPYAVLYVRRDAPLSVCEAAYRALARTAHPDVGGDAAQMQRLNEAIEVIRKEKGE